LVDVEGFPRGDIDLFNVRNKRQRLAVINTDHKALMLEIEATLQALHREEPSSTSSGSSSSSSGNSSSSSSSVGGSSRWGGSGPEVVTVTSKAFAVIDEILEGSPAATAGVHDGDELLQFGSVTSLTTDALNALPAVVRDHVNRPIAVTVRRKDVLATLTLVPQSWGGRGLVGCHFTPITQM
jgi:26S proteasome non-ATPase regulatory subunit 9